MFKSRSKKKLIITLAAAMSMVCLYKNDAYATVNPGDKIDVVFTSDLHSNIVKYDDIVDGEQINNVGGFAKLKTFIDKKRAENKDTVVIDCGDVVMGTISHALIDTEAYELGFLNSTEYDAITCGNHEFDFGAKALSDMYSVVADKYEKRAPFVICNVDWEQNDEYTKTLKEGASKYGLEEYIIIEKNGVRIAITGVLGVDAIKCSPTCELTFTDPIESVKKTVEKIKKNENPDLIICLSHSGTGPVLGDTEDENLAKKVPDLDLIISGHTHTVLDDGVVVGNTSIASCGAYGLYTGTVSLTRNSNGRWDMTDYELVMMDDSIEEDQETLEDIERLMDDVDRTVLAPYGMKSKDIIACNKTVVFETSQDTLDNHTEMKLGNILSDSYRYVANTTPTGQEKQFDIAVVPSGTIRDTITKGNITVADAFSCLSLGKGKDGNVGYPLVSLYLTGKEIRTIAEVDASISDLMTTARLYISGVCVEYNPNRMILNKTIDVWRNPAILEESYEQLDNDRLYRIVTDSYSMSMLGAVTDMSKGILSVVPKDENGNPITNADDFIIYDSEGNELKAWVALVDYLKSFERNDEGISEIPEYYNSYHNRKVVNDSHSLRAMFKNTSKYFYIIVAICLLIILIIVFIIRSIVKKNHRKKVFK